MKDKDLLVVYETSSQKAIKLINTMRLVITELKERVNPAKEPKGISKKSGYPEGKPCRCRK